MTFNQNAISPPKVTISPCAKFVSPVVPKIRDKPTEQMAMIRPRRIPSTDLWRILSNNETELVALAPVKKRTSLSFVVNASFSMIVENFSSLMRDTPSGNEATSSVIT